MVDSQMVVSFSVAKSVICKVLLYQDFIQQCKLFKQEIFLYKEKKTYHQLENKENKKESERFSLTGIQNWYNSVAVKVGGNITPSLSTYMYTYAGSFNVKVPFVCFMQINSRGNETSSDAAV